MPDNNDASPGRSSTSPQVPPERYRRLDYCTKARFVSYWHQLDEVLREGPDTVLEIGTGPGVVARELRQLGADLVTVDIDPELAPSVSGSVTGLPFADRCFHTTLCCQVLEHIPYDRVAKALTEIHRVTRCFAIVSIAHNSPYLSCRAELWPAAAMGLGCSLPKLRNRAITFNGEHYWEIGRTGYPLRRVLAEMERVGFRVLATYRVPEHPYHRFFRLEIPA